MGTDDYDDIFAQAASIAGKVPKHLQEVAFNRALDELLKRSPVQRQSTPHSKRSESHAPVGKEASNSTPQALIDAIDRTRYADIGSTSRIADRALRVLQLALHDHDIDGLSAAAIAQVLTAKFRLATTTNAVRMALERETNTVNVRQGSDGTRIFHLMAPGEEYLKTLTGGAEPARQSVRRRRVRKTPKSVPVGDPESPSKPKQKGAASGARGSPRRQGRPGPKQAVQILLASGFFDEPRAIAAIQGELRHFQGHQYTVQELSPALVRSVRDKSLSRARNPVGQYEYSKA